MSSSPLRRRTETTTTRHRPSASHPPRPVGATLRFATRTGAPRAGAGRRTLFAVLSALLTLASGPLRATVDEPVDPSLSPTAVEDPLGGDRLLRKRLVVSVLERNPSIAAARAALRESEARIERAGELDDPMASVSTAPLSWFGDHRSGFGFGARQKLPWPGTLGLREERAAAEAAATAGDLEALRFQLALEAARLFDRYHLIHRSLEINDEHLRLLRTFQEVATGRYATGLVPLQAPIQAEVETTHLEHRRVILDAGRRRLVARINALLHRSASAELPPPENLERTPPAAESGLGEPLDRPEIDALEARLDAARQSVELERLDFRPSFEIGTEYSSMWAASDHRWMVGAGIRIPLWRKRLRAEVAEAEARVEVRESQLDSVRDAVDAEVVEARLDLEEALDVVRLYESRVLPATEDQIEAARSGFETGQVSMLSLIEAERSLRTAKLELAEARTEAWTARARLDRALGRLPVLGQAPESRPGGAARAPLPLPESPSTPPPSEVSR